MNIFVRRLGLLGLTLLVPTLVFAAPAKKGDVKVRDPLKDAQRLASGGKVEEARAILDKILQKEPRNAKAWFLLGSVYQDMSVMDGGFRKSKDCYYKALAIDPQYSEAFRKLGELAGIDGNWQEEIKFDNTALSCPVPDYRAYKARAIAKGNLHQDKEALADYELFRKNMPAAANGPRGMDEYATFLENAGKYTEAIKTLEILEKIDGRPSLPVRRAKYYLKAGKPNEAIAILNIMISKEPEDETLYADRAKIFTGAGRYKEALKDWNKVIEVTPASKYYEARAAIYDKLADPQRAKADRVKALERN